MLDKILAEEKELADSAKARREEEERERTKREEWEEKHPILYSVEQFCQSVRGSVQEFLDEQGAAWFFLFVFLSFFSYGVLSKLGKMLRRIKMKRYRKQPALEHIPGYQKTLWDFLCNTADGSGRISMKNLKKYIKDNQEDALKFRKNFEGAVEREYTERVKSEDKEKHSSGWGRRCLLFSAAVGILAMLIWMFSTLYDGVQIGDSLMVGLFTFLAMIIILGLICFEISIVKDESVCRILDQQGENDLALWEAFGRFFDDLTSFETKELSEFSVWQEYMVYAVAMGKGKKVAKALTLKYPEASSTGTDTFNDDIYRMMQDMELYDAMDSIGLEVAEVRDTSSYGGDGGGFSDSGGGSDSGSGGDFID